MIRGLFLFILSALICSVSFASNLDTILNQSKKNNLSQTKEWKNLLHWRWNLIGGTEGEADTDNFYFAKDGQENLEHELSATITSFINTKMGTDVNEHPICKFPARYLFLEKHLNISSVRKKPNCAKYNKFSKKLAAKGISLVFSSYFISRPASAFGHTLMRFSKSDNVKEGQKHELLDYAANYSANVTTGNALLYGVMGLAGGFRGEFASMPYFYKIREYSDYESRDLWDYHLNLKPEEIERVVAHLWEMGSTFFRYFYLTQNCSYHMLGLIDVANPELGLTDNIPYFVIPADTIALVAKTPGLLKEVTYRPSKMTVLKHRISLLDKEERILFEKTIEHLKPLKLDISKKKQAKILDTAMDYIDFKFAEEILFKESKEKVIKTSFLIARAQLGIKSDELKVPTPVEEMPHLGHKARRLGLGFGTSSKSDFFSTFEFRFAMHELLDLSTGQNPNASMEMGDLKFRYNQEDKNQNNTSNIRVDEFSAVNIVAITPLEPYFSDLSWRAKFGGRTVKDGGCLDCLSPTAQVAAGAAVKMGPVMTYLMAATEIDFHKDLGHRGYRAAVGPEAKLLYRLGKTLTLDISGEWKRNFFVEENKTSYSYGSEVRFHTFQNINFGLQYKRFHKFWDSSAKLYYYF